jgi:cytochrome P450
MKLGKNKPGLYMDTKMAMPSLIVSDPYLLEEIYVTKNRYFERHRLGENLFKPIVGTAILAAPADGTWAMKRKILTGAFYKDKLMILLEMVLKIADLRMKEWELEYANKKDIPFDLP